MIQFRQKLNFEAFYARHLNSYIYGSHNKEKQYNFNSFSLSSSKNFNKNQPKM